MSDTIIAALITGVVSLIVGFFSGYKYCMKNSKRYNQKSGNNSIQIQTGDIKNEK